MHEVQGNSVTYYAHYTEDGVNKTGLTVTITVYEILRDGTKTEIVSDGTCVEIGDGLYRYILAGTSVDAAADYIAVFHTATDTVDAQDIPALWVIDRANLEDIDDILTDTGTDGVKLADDAITSAKFDESTAFPLKSADTGASAVARVGADSDTLETLSDQLDAAQNSIADISTWVAINIGASVTSGLITQIRGNTWDIDIADITLDTNKQQFYIKRASNDPDDKALIGVDNITGLLVLNGRSDLTAANASLSYNSVDKKLTIHVEATETAQLPTGTWEYGIQDITTAGVVSEKYKGNFTVAPDIVWATS